MKMYPAKIYELKNIPMEQWSILDGFTFSSSDISARCDLSEKIVSAVIDAFSFSEDGNPTFSSLQDFNAADATSHHKKRSRYIPVVPLHEPGRGFVRYAILLDAERRWLSRHSSGKPGKIYSEEFAAGRLEKVFRADRVFRNVDIWEPSARKNKVGEIDALVRIGDRAIVVQAKSKKLTLAARKGNDQQLRADFKGAVQDACDQAIACSQYLLDGVAVFVDANGKELPKLGPVKRIYPVCVVSDHYPSLSFQAREFLAVTTSEKIEFPLVCDVFFMDVLTEFLDTPLRCLSYLELRAKAGNDFIYSHEITALGYHLKQNIWLGDFDLLHGG